MILQKWFNSDEAQWSYTKEFPYRIRPWKVYYALSREHNPIYFGCIQKTDWTWSNYFSIHQRARIHGSVKVIFYAVAIDPANNWWSPWFKLFLFKYMPRATYIADRNFREFVNILSWELHVPVQNDFALEFDFVHTKTTVLIADEKDESFKLSVKFKGRISVDEADRPPHFYTFPFYCCLHEQAPPWLDESIPYEVLAPDVDEEIISLNQLYRPKDEHAARDMYEYDYDDRANSD